MLAVGNFGLAPPPKGIKTQEWALAWARKVRTLLFALVGSSLEAIAQHAPPISGACNRGALAPPEDATRWQSAPVEFLDPERLQRDCAMSVSLPYVAFYAALAPLVA